jgi:predicted XRE-type DNA-binding protein
MTYKEEIEKNWTKAGGLITQATAGKILGVNRSAISRRKDIKKFIIENDKLVSYTEIMNRKDIKPRKKR